MKNSALTVYKASAGSGKTFRLAVEYIKCLIENPKAYEGILAVTFTNKATEEMKMRILSTLYGLSRQIEGTKSYMDRICEEMNVKPEFVTLQAKEALNNLLHNYSYFRVETIDKFFQTVLRNLARELDLTPNLKVELGAKEIEHEAVDQLIEGLKENSQVMNWIMDFIRSAMDDNKAWNIIDKIKDFGEQLLKDEYKAAAKGFDLNNEEIYRGFKGQLIALKKTCDEEVQAIGKELIEAIKLYEPSGDPLIFKGGSRGIGGYILKIAEGSINDIKEPSKTILQALDDCQGDCWVNKKADDGLRIFAVDTIRPKLAKAIKRINELKKIYNSCNHTIAHISELRLLNEIDKRIKESNAENGRFLLSDTQTLLQGMIRHSDSPFIYEKIGSHLKRIMIDEFQDTSIVQWQNFKVLLSDCMSHGNGSLIVGDVKQSIYRWRSGDWRLLNNIQSEFTQPVDSKTLGDNYRSCPNIIHFNNAFFRIANKLVYNAEVEHLPDEEAGMLSNAYRYSTLRQNIPAKDRSKDSSDGFVEVLAFRYEDEESYTQQTHDAIVERIRQLREMGVKDNRIAIIVRSNFHIGPIADYCMQEIPGLNVVSDEAFRLDASRAVMVIIDAMRLILNKEDVIARARLMQNYQNLILANKEEISSILLSEDNDRYLPEEFIKDYDHLKTLPLYQLAERLYSIFDVGKLNEEAAFVCTLFDCINEFISHQTPSLASWIDYWDTKISTKTIESDSDDGLRIISIHKSKGLEFDHVICPFMDWTMNKSNILWANPSVEPFNKIGLIPLDYSSNLVGSIYEHDYRYEHLQNAVDDLNLLYVAFTRASKNLFIMTRDSEDMNEKKRDANRAPLLNDTMEVMCNEEPGSDDDISYENLHIDKDTSVDGMIRYSFGQQICITSAIMTEKKKETQENVFEQKPEHLIMDSVQTFNRQQEFRQSNESKVFTAADDEDEQVRNTYIQLGSLLHYVFQNIHTEQDIPRALLQIEQEGLIFGQDVTVDDINSKLQKCFENPLIKSWFTDEWIVYNECTILEPEGTSFVQHRPDRVIMKDGEAIVIDFKLSKPKPEYKGQVQRYMRLLQDMGHKNVKGYLLYMLPAKVEPVV